jgi:hypothetical protein
MKQWWRKKTGSWGLVRVPHIWPPINTWTLSWCLSNLSISRAAVGVNISEFYRFRKAFWIMLHLSISFYLSQYYAANICPPLVWSNWPFLRNKLDKQIDCVGSSMTWSKLESQYGKMTSRKAFSNLWNIQ